LLKINNPISLAPDSQPVPDSQPQELDPLELHNPEPSDPLELQKPDSHLSESHLSESESQVLKTEPPASESPESEVAFKLEPDSGKDLEIKSELSQEKTVDKEGKCCAIN
jgi:hypothetical protein